MGKHWHWITCGLLTGIFLIGEKTFQAQSTALSGHGYRITFWTTEEGLPQNTVNDICQTRDGYLWFTTLDGLVRYDGVRFRVSNKSNSPGLASNRLLRLVEDADGALWIGSDTHRAYSKPSPPRTGCRTTG